MDELEIVIDLCRWIEEQKQSLRMWPNGRKFVLDQLEDLTPDDPYLCLVIVASCFQGFTWQPKRWVGGGVRLTLALRHPEHHRHFGSDQATAETRLGRQMTSKHSKRTWFLQYGLGHTRTEIEKEQHCKWFGQVNQQNFKVIILKSQSHWGYDFHASLIVPRRSRNRRRPTWLTRRVRASWRRGRSAVDRTFPGLKPYRENAQCVIYNSKMYIDKYNTYVYTYLYIISCSTCPHKYEIYTCCIRAIISFEFQNYKSSIVIRYAILQQKPT